MKRSNAITERSIVLVLWIENGMMGDDVKPTRFCQARGRRLAVLGATPRGSDSVMFAVQVAPLRLKIWSDRQTDAHNFAKDPLVSRESKKPITGCDSFFLFDSSWCW